MTPQELGPYLLLRKLSENALCETYRAGQRSGQEVERVVLLYFFNCDPDDALWISETAEAGRRALAGLESPSLSPAVDSGEVAGTAYLTYDYIPGRSLEVVLEKARRLETAIPIEHALLVVDRIAQALQAAWEHESRALHGFVVPHLVMLSNEGDVQLLGLEVASRLRKLLTDERVRQQMGRYLAPEVVPEGQPSTTDDVFSLGALLFELVTGQELPAAEDLGEAIAGARTPDGEPLPGTIVELLETSVATAFGRSDLATWRAGLSALLASGEYDANAFNLALFLHTLFGDEIESETEEVLGEGAMLGFGASATASEAIGDSTEMEAAELSPSNDGEPSDELEELPAPLLTEETSGTGRRGRFLAVAAGIVVALGVGFGAFKLFAPSSGGMEIADQSSEPIPLSAPEMNPQLGIANPAVDEQPTVEQAAALSPEEIDERVQELLSQRSADMESSLRREFESELAVLREQLARAQEQAAAAAEPEAVEEVPGIAPAEAEPSTLRLAALESSEQLTGAATGIAVPASKSANESAVDEPAAEDMAGGALSEPADVASSVEPRDVETTDLLDLESEGSSERDASSEASRSTARSEPVVEMDKSSEPAAREADPPRQQSAVSEPPAKAEAAARVQVGDLVTPGPGVTLPSIVSPAQPVYPMLARRLKKSAVVTVKVLVDENGRVTDAERLSEEAGYGFDASAVQAARETRFEPATKDGVRVKMWWTVRIAFQP